MWLGSLRNYDGDGNGNDNVNGKEKAFIKENNNSGLFQAFRQWRVARNEERKGKKGNPLSLLPPPLYLLPPPLFSLPHPLSPHPYRTPLLSSSSLFFALYPLSERLKQANFSTFRFRHSTTTKWNFLTSNFKFYGGRRHKMKFFLFFPWTWIRFLRIQL